MAIDQLMVSFNLDKIECLDEGDGGGTAEPFLWVVYFKIDGDTVFVGSDFMLQGSATVVGTSGSRGIGLVDNEGLRLEHMVTYEDNGVRRWAGSYRSGNWAHRLILDRDGTTFAKETQDLFDHKDLRLEQLVTYVHNGVRRWGGIYRSGDCAQRFTMDRDTRTFIEETREWLRHDGLRLIDLERYEVNGQARWAGVYRSGDWGQRLIVDSGIESLRAQTQHFVGNAGSMAAKLVN